MQGEKIRRGSNRETPRQSDRIQIQQMDVTVEQKNDDGCKEMKI